ncbi:MAG: metal ABC transporter solute-binding protein, Zn/Mn family [Lactovum sp.]
MKKIVMSVLALLMLSVFSGCSQVKMSNDKALTVVSTIFAPYDFVKQIAGENAEVTMLVPPGSESHSYEPTPQDMIKIEKADIFIYSGGESDTWVEEILKSVDTSQMQVIALTDLVDTVEEKVVEGMQDDEHDHNHNHEEGIFDDSEVKNRELSDWAGDWQSVYPYLLDGTLDKVMEAKAETDSEMTVSDYEDYYKKGYQTDIEEIKITDSMIEFIKDGKSSKSEYKYAGYKILTYESGSRGVRYLFEAVDKTSTAPKYVQFSDHGIEPTDAEHFHIYFSDEDESQEALLEELENWPTYYTSDLTGSEVATEMLSHEGEEEEVEYDEHVWTSPKNAKKIVEKLSKSLIEIDSEHAEDYNKNTEAYLEKLDQLDTDFASVVEEASRKTLLFGDRFPFRYFADDYGLDYYAAFPGCSTETEASAATIAFLIDKVKEEKIPVVFHAELSSGKISQTISEETGAKVLQLHACHNVTKDEMEEGVTYLELMQENVKNLKEALK